MPINNRLCDHCKKKFYSSIGKEYCRACSNKLGLVEKRSEHKSMIRKIKKLCTDVKVYEKEIYLLAAKSKWDLLNPADFYKVAHIFMDVVCNENKYSTKTPDMQAILMLDELVKLLEYKKIEHHYRRYQARGVVQLDKKGKVIRTFSSIKQAVEVLDYCDSTIKRACDGKKTLIKEILKWKSDVNI